MVIKREQSRTAYMNRMAMRPSSGYFDNRVNPGHMFGENFSDDFNRPIFMTPPATYHIALRPHPFATTYYLNRFHHRHHDHDSNQRTVGFGDLSS